MVESDHTQLALSPDTADVVSQIAGRAVAALELRRPYLERLIKRHFPDNPRAAILDLGCGFGALFYFLRRAGYSNLQAVDSSPDQIAMAQRLGISGVRLGDALQALQATESQSQDVVVAFDLMEHLSADVLPKFVDEVSRVLKPRGRFIVHAPNGESPFCSRVRYGDPTHHRAFTQSSICPLLLSSGFAEVHCYEDSPTVHGFKSLLRWIVWKGVRGLLRLWLAAETGETTKQAIFTQNFLVAAVRD
jgi:SAM-dependent methyltransferase